MTTKKAPVTRSLQPNECDAPAWAGFNMLAIEITFMLKAGTQTTVAALRLLRPVSLASCLYLQAEARREAKTPEG